MEKTFDFNTIGKRMPYTVPEDFFAKLEEDVMQDVRKEDTPAKSQNKALRIVMSSVLAVAAAVALFLVLHPMINKNDTISADNYASVEMAFNNLSSDDQDFLITVYEDEIILMDDLEFNP